MLVQGSMSSPTYCTRFQGRYLQHHSSALCVYVFSVVIVSNEPTVLLLPELRPSFLNRILNLKQHLNNTFKLIYKEGKDKSQVPLCLRCVCREGEVKWDHMLKHTHTVRQTDRDMHTYILFTHKHGKLLHYKHVFVSKLLASCIYFPSYNFHIEDYNKSSLLL